MSDLTKPLTEDEVILYTRQKRMQLANDLTQQGAPKDKDSQCVLLATLDGLDRSALGRLKIKAEERANANNASAAALIAQVLNEIGSTKIYEFQTTVIREIPRLPDSIPKPDIVEGELETNPQQIDFETFTKQFDDLEPV